MESASAAKTSNPSPSRTFSRKLLGTNPFLPLNSACVYVCMCGVCVCGGGGGGGGGENTYLYICSCGLEQKYAHVFLPIFM